jgi:DEAD/DEAH box helicase domain-containing protein
MGQLNTLALRDTLIKRVTDFAVDEHFVRDPNLAEALRKLWSGRPENGGLGSDLWVEGAFPSTPAGETMQELVARGLVHKGLGKQLDATGAFPLDLTPYQHQLDSIEAAASNDYPNGARPGIVVTAGTGAGKTESFLIPMLNELWRAPGQPGGGISALILYPMNALVNDQVGRLDKWLAGQNSLSFFHFTSETPENARSADNRNLPPATPARFRTRQQARGREDENGKAIKNGTGANPDVLVTNYSMLEYMLCRPQDAVFFGQNLRVIVLDEAHIYSGNLAAEITFLLRRVLMRCGRNPEDVLCIATSATIGGGIDELRPFAARLFSKPENLVRVIAGKPQRPTLAATASPLPLSSDLVDALNTKPFPNEDTLAVEDGNPAFRTASEESWKQWTAALAALVSHADHQSVVLETAESRLPARLLAKALSHSGAIAALQDVLWNGGAPRRIPLQELANTVFGSTSQHAIEAARQMLQVGAIARNRPGSLPLVPNRIHYLLRGPEGILLAFEDNHAEAMIGIRDGLKIFSPGADPSAFGLNAQHPLTLFRCNESGWWGVAGKQVNGILEPVPASIVLYGQDESQEADPEVPNAPQPSRIRLYSLEEIPGRPCIYFDPATARYGGTGPVPLWEVEECPLSGTALTPESVGWFSARARLQLSVVAETALAAMAEYPDDSRAWKPARGRRLLVFSDSRAEAARLGPRLTRQHELQVFRAAVLERLENVNLAGTEADLAELRNDIEKLRDKIAVASPARRPSLQRQLAEEERNLQQMGEGGTVADWGLVLRESEIVKELYHAPGGKDHQPGRENAPDAWTSNSKEIVDSLAPLLGRELARRPAWPNPSLETLGLVEVVYPGIRQIPAPEGLLGVLPAAILAQLEEVWPDYLAALLDAVRNQGAITLGGQEKDRDYQYGNGLLGKMFSAEQAYRRSMIPLIGVKFEGAQASRRNTFTRRMLIALGLPEAEASEKSRELMLAAFNALLAAAQAGTANWLKFDLNAPTNSDNAVPALQIRFHFLGLRRPSMLFLCSRTGQVWPRSVAGLYPGAPAPVLSEVAHEEIDEDIRLRRRRGELRDWTGFKLGLWAEEHSAQLSPDENARLQNLFREGMRNILSSTTTLELGIDIGGLSAVLLGNLPPGKANYLQRAGRAGRRADGTSAVLGFARPTAYEREVFLDFSRYLDRELRRPTVFLDRAPLARRHAHAWLLGEFFRNHFAQRGSTGAMDAYGRMGAFTGQSLPDIWENAQPKPQRGQVDPNPISSQFLIFLEGLIVAPQPDMAATLRRLWAGCANVNTTDVAWAENIRSIRDEFDVAISQWTKMASELADAWAEVPNSTTDGQFRAQANAIRYQLLTLHKLTVIESLADSRVLPRYGFPIGLSRLRVQVPDGHGRATEEDQFRLQRDGMMAMREYTPGSQLLVGGKIITSRGLLKHWTGAVMRDESWGLRGRFVRTNRGFFDYNLTGVEPQLPPQGMGGNISTGVFLFPKHGFTTAAWDPPQHGSEFERIGNLGVFTLAFANPGDCDPLQVNFGGMAFCSATYRNAGELLLMNFGANEKGFAICQKCGCAESEWKSGSTGRVDLPNRFEWHAPLNSANPNSRCWADDEAPVWRNHHLAAKQTTHLLRIDIGGISQQTDRELLYTLGQALRLTAAQTLELDEREIGALDPVPDPLTGQFRSVILYDSLAGGSGHLAELSHPGYPERAREWIDRTVKLLTVEGVMPEAVRHREVIRRLLTSACDDSLLVPERALDFLVSALSALAPNNPNLPEEPNIPPDAWTLERLQAEDPPETFALYLPANVITGVADGLHSFQRYTIAPGGGLPNPNIVVVLRDLRATPGISIGRWLYRRTDDPDRPHRVHLRRLTSPVSMDLTEAEFNQLQILAVAI